MVSLTLGNIRKPQGRCFSGYASYPVLHPTNGPIHPSTPYPHLPPWPSTMCTVFASRMFALRVTNWLLCSTLSDRRWFVFHRASAERTSAPLTLLHVPVNCWCRLVCSTLSDSGWLVFTLDLHTALICPHNPPPCACELPGASRAGVTVAGWAPRVPAGPSRNRSIGKSNSCSQGHKLATLPNTERPPVAFFFIGPPQGAQLPPQPSTMCLRAAGVGQTGVGMTRCIRRAYLLFLFCPNVVKQARRSRFRGSFPGYMPCSLVLSRFDIRQVVPQRYIAPWAIHRSQVRQRAILQFCTFIPSMGGRTCFQRAPWDRFPERDRAEHMAVRALRRRAWWGEWLSTQGPDQGGPGGANHLLVVGRIHFQRAPWDRFPDCPGFWPRQLQPSTAEYFSVFWPWEP